METILKSLNYIGIKEVAGPASSPTILGWIRKIASWANDDELSWCSVFVNQIAEECNLERTGKLNARSWLEVGQQVSDPRMGDVVVLWRESPTSWKGHVGFFVRQNATHVWVLGGNQSNMVSIAPYPRTRVLSYRRLRPAQNV